jgi:hypothetical protein
MILPCKGTKKNSHFRQNIPFLAKKGAFLGIFGIIFGFSAHLERNRVILKKFKKYSSLYKNYEKRTQFVA